MTEWSEVYVMAEVGSEPLVKVGVSGNPEQRCRDLAAVRHLPLQLAWQSGALENPYAVEWQAHEALSACAVKREWFATTPPAAICAVKEAMERVARGAFGTAPRISTDPSVSISTIIPASLAARVRVFAASTRSGKISEAYRVLLTAGLAASTKAAR